MSLASWVVGVLLLECLLVEPHLRLVVARGVLVSTGLGMTLVCLRLALHLGIVGDEIVEVSIVEADVLARATPPLHIIVVKLHKPTGHKRQAKEI